MKRILAPFAYTLLGATLGAAGLGLYVHSVKLEMLEAAAKYEAVYGTPAAQRHFPADADTQLATYAQRLP